MEEQQCRNINSGPRKYAQWKYGDYYPSAQVDGLNMLAHYLIPPPAHVESSDHLCLSMRYEHYMMHHAIHGKNVMPMVNHASEKLML